MRPGQATLSAQCEHAGSGPTPREVADRFGGETPSGLLSNIGYHLHVPKSRTPMLSTRKLVRQPFFNGFSAPQLISLAAHTEEVGFQEGEVLFRPDDELDFLYVLVSGAVGIFLNLARPEEDRPGYTAIEPRVVHSLRPGDVFSWSALMPPHRATAGAMALGPAMALRLDARSLLDWFDRDPGFGYLMMQKLAGVIHDRLYQRRILDLEGADPY